MYQAGEYDTLISTLANLSPMSYSELKDEDMTLLHHAAIDGNIDVIKKLQALPYY